MGEASIAVILVSFVSIVITFIYGFGGCVACEGVTDNGDDDGGGDDGGGGIRMIVSRDLKCICKTVLT